MNRMPVRRASLRVVDARLGQGVVSVALLRSTVSGIFIRRSHSLARVWITHRTKVKLC